MTATVGDPVPCNVDFSNVVSPDTDATYHGHNVVAEMRSIFMENASMMQTNIEGDLDTIHLKDQVSEAAKEFADDLQDALTAAAAQGTKGQVTLSATQMAQLQSFAQQNGVNVDGEDIGTFLTSAKITANSSGSFVMTQQNAGDLVAGMNDCSQSASDSSQQIMTSLQMLYNYLNADYTSTTSALKDGTDLLSSVGRNM